MSACVAAHCDTLYTQDGSLLLRKQRLNVCVEASSLLLWDNAYAPGWSHGIGALPQKQCVVLRIGVVGSVRT